MEFANNAVENKKHGLNCAQAVAVAFAEEIGLDETMAIKMTEAFGLGMGCAKGTCGAVTGAMCILGLAFSNKTIDDTKAQSQARAYAKELFERFEEKNGSTVCCELKGMETGKVLRDCNGCVYDAAYILEDILRNK